jgi:hypothetical protein
MEVKFCCCCCIICFAHVVSARAIILMAGAHREISSIEFVPYKCARASAFCIYETHTSVTQSGRECARLMASILLDLMVFLTKKRQVSVLAKSSFNFFSLKMEISSETLELVFSLRGRLFRVIKIVITHFSEKLLRFCITLTWICQINCL